MTVLICGSMAFDNIMVFNDRFKNHILPDRVHNLNVSFMAEDKQVEFGGCAGNIAYNLNLLGVEAVPQATVGDDFSTYAQWMDECGISRSQIMELPGEHTSSAFIITDIDGNQVTAFHAGAMLRSHEIDVKGDIAIGILAPEGREGMLLHARQMKKAGIPFVFDPGQGTPMFTAAELDNFISDAGWLACNDYESRMICKMLNTEPAALAQRVNALIITRGGEGSDIYADGKHYRIPAAPVREAIDPTGCGDAYRAGLLYGLLHRLDWETTGRLASLMGAIKVECSGTQNHRFKRDEFNERFALARRGHSGSVWRL